jgi:putative ABC transport system permease protein
MNFLLRTLSLSYVRCNIAKTLLTLLGVIVGVATFSSIQSAQGTLINGIRSTVDRIAGKAQLQITMVGGVPEEVQEKVRDLPEIRATSPVIEQLVVLEKGELGTLLVIGVDLLGDREMRDYGFEGQAADLDDPLLFLAQADSALFTKQFAQRANLQLNETIALRLPKGIKRVMARGILTPKGFAEAFGGNLMVVDVYAAQELFGRGRRFDRIDIRLAEGTTIAQGRETLQKALGPAFTIETPGNRGEQVEKLVTNFTASFNASSIFALCIGAFLIFNSFNVSVNRRRRDIGTLRSIGATPRQIQLLFLAEALIIGIIGGIIGCFTGTALAQNFLQLMGQTTEKIYGVTSSGITHLTPAIVFQSIFLGILASLVGAWRPALAASRISPTEAFAKGKFQSRISGKTAPWVITGIITFGLAIGCALHPPYVGNPFIFTVLILGGVGLVILIGPLSRWLMRGLLPLIQKFAPVAGLLASDAILGNIRRTSGTMLAMALSLTFVLGLGGYLGSTRADIGKWMNNIMTSDIYVRASANFARPDLLFPEGLRDDLRKVPGVSIIESYRTVRPQYKGHEILFGSLEFDTAIKRLNYEFIQGNKESLLQEGTCYVSENFYRLFGLGVGQEVELPTPGGMVRIPIVAVVRDYTCDQGSVFMDRAQFLRLWKDDRVEIFEITVIHGSDVNTVRDAIRKTISGKYPAIVSTSREFIAEIGKAVEAFNTLTQITVFLALGVAFLGIITSLLISVMERIREIGILKAQGALFSQIAWGIVTEAFALSFVCLILAIPAGNLFAHFMEGPVAEVFTGWSMPHRYPWDTLIQLLIALPLVSAFASWVPARQAGKLKITEAIEYE